MPTIPKCVKESDLSSFLLAELRRIHQGKVADTYQLDGGLRLIVRTDRVSIFDFVLPCLVEEKGVVLTQMTTFWLRDVLSDYPNHLVAAGEEIDQYLPASLRGYEYLHARAVVVKTLNVLPVECIVRGYLTGSGWAAYGKDNGVVCGVQLPPGLHDGSQLPNPIFTPTTKAEAGHDEHIDAAGVVREYGGWIRTASLDLYHRVNECALRKGFILADTKLEFGDCQTLGDEVCTPDSSRWWSVVDWANANEQSKAPLPHDKQFLRNWGMNVRTPFADINGGVGIHKLDPENPQHVAFVHSLVVPPELLQQTADIYSSICLQLTS